MLINTRIIENADRLYNNLYITTSDLRKLILFHTSMIKYHERDSIIQSFHRLRRDSLVNMMRARRLRR